MLFVNGAHNKDKCWVSVTSDVQESKLEASSPSLKPRGYSAWLSETKKHKLPEFSYPCLEAA